MIGLMDLMLRPRPKSGNQRFMPYGPFGVQPQQGGYDSSGINPHGMYNGTFGQMPHNPGGVQPMGGLAGMFNRYRGS